MKAQTRQKVVSRRPTDNQSEHGPNCGIKRTNNKFN